MDESAQRMISLLGPLAGGSKIQEYLRTIELLNKIWRDKGLYYALAFLYDSGYNRQDIEEMMALLYPPNNVPETISNKTTDLIIWLSNCPYSIDPATVPKEGIDANSSQVVGQLSLALDKYNDLQTIAKTLKDHEI